MKIYMIKNEDNMFFSSGRGWKGCWSSENVASAYMNEKHAKAQLTRLRNQTRRHSRFNNIQIVEIEFDI